MCLYKSWMKRKLPTKLSLFLRLSFILGFCLYRFMETVQSANDDWKISAGQHKRLAVYCGVLVFDWDNDFIWSNSFGF